MITCFTNEAGLVDTFDIESGSIAGGGGASMRSIGIEGAGADAGGCSDFAVLELETAAVDDDSFFFFLFGILTVIVFFCSSSIGMESGNGNEAEDTTVFSGVFLGLGC